MGGAAGIGADQGLPSASQRLGQLGSWTRVSRTTVMWSAAVLEPALPSHSRAATGSPTPAGPASRFPHNDGGTNHRLDHATSQDRTIRLKGLPYDDQIETRRARRSDGKGYTLDCDQPVRVCQRCSKVSDSLVMYSGVMGRLYWAVIPWSVHAWATCSGAGLSVWSRCSAQTL